MSEVTRFTRSSGLLKYKVDYNTNITKLSNDELKNEIFDAFSHWFAVSSFTFIETEGDDWNIHLSFGDLPADATDDTLAHQRLSKSVQDGKPIPDKKEIVFGKSVTWKDLKKEYGAGGNSNLGGYNWIALLKNVNDVYDVATIAMHEIGHALGLNHSANVDSIMQARLGLGGKIYYFKRERPLAEIDAQGIADLYGTSYANLPPLSGGYAIVGSTFRMTDEISRAPYSEIWELCWGVREAAPTVPLIAGRGFNPRLKAGSGYPGYGYLHVHMMPQADLAGRQYVIGGGVLKPSTKVDAVLLPQPDTTNYSIANGGFVSTNWGSDDGEKRYFARGKSYNERVGNDTDSLFYFVVSRPGETTYPPFLINGFKTLAAEGKNTIEGQEKIVRSWGDLSGTPQFIGCVRVSEGSLNDPNGWTFLHSPA